MSFCISRREPVRLYLAVQQSLGVWARARRHSNTVATDERPDPTSRVSEDTAGQAPSRSLRYEAAPRSKQNYMHLIPVGCINKAPAEGAGFLPPSFFLEPPQSSAAAQGTQQSTVSGLVCTPPRPEQQQGGDVAGSFLTCVLSSL